MVLQSNGPMMLRRFYWPFLHWDGSRDRAQAFCSINGCLGYETQKAVNESATNNLYCGFKRKGCTWLHSRKVTWTLKNDLWMTIFLDKPVVFRVQVFHGVCGDKL